MASIAPKTILLVDDEAIIAMAEASLLRKHGYAVLTALSGEQAVAAAAERAEIGLVLMDIDLGPGMDGTEAAAAILRGKDVPILFLSSHGEPEIVERTERISSYGYIVKNSGETVLLASLRMAYRLHEAHRALRESEEKLSAIYEGAPCAITISDLDTAVIVDANRGIEWTGWKREEVLGMTPEALGSWVDPEQGLGIRGALAGGEAMLNREVPFRKKDGTMAHALMSSKRIELGGKAHIMTVSIDVTKAVESERRLRRADEEAETVGRELRSLFEACPAGVALLRDRRIVKVNGLLCRMTGFSAEELVGEPTRAFYASEEEYQRVGAALKAMIESDGIGSIDARLRVKDGSYLDVMLSALYVDPSDPAAGMVVTVLDLRGQKRAEAALAQALRQVNDIISFLPDPTFVVDRDHRVMAWNRAMERLTGVAAADIIGRGGYEHALPFYGTRRPILIDLFDIPVDEIEAKYEYVKVADQTIYAEVFIPHFKDGEGVYLWGAASALFDERGNRSGGIEIIRDVSELKRGERSLARALEEQETLHHELQHRIKNTLAMITSLIGLESGRSREEGERKILRSLRSRIDSLSSLYSLLHEAGPTAEVALDEYVGAIVSSVASSYAGAEREVRIDRRLDRVSVSVKNATAWGLIANELLTNALKYAIPAGAREVLVLLERSGGDASLSVIDDGSGPGPDFDVARSSGVGLLLVGALAKQLGGTFDFARTGKNAFTVRAPA
jgi:PAS domain S-box-containing protein